MLARFRLTPTAPPGRDAQLRRDRVPASPPLGSRSRTPETHPPVLATAQIVRFLQPQAADPSQRTDRRAPRHRGAPIAFAQAPAYARDRRQAGPPGCCYRPIPGAGADAGSRDRVRRQRTGTDPDSHALLRALLSARTETPRPHARLSLTWASARPRRERFLPAGPRAPADSALAFKRRAEVRRGWRRMPTLVCAEASYRAARDQPTHSCRRRVVSLSCALRPAAARADRQRDRRLADRMPCSVGARTLGASALGSRRRRRLCAAGRG